MKAKSIVAALLISVVAGCGQSESASVACLPKNAADEAPISETSGGKPEQAPRATLYLDVSLSMVNYLDSRKVGGARQALDQANSFQFGALTRRLPPILKRSAQRVVLAGFSVSANRTPDNRLTPQYDLNDEQFRQLTATECFTGLSKDKPRESCYGLYKGNKRTDFSGLFPDVEARVVNGELVAIVSDLMSYGAGQLGDYNDVAGPLAGLIRKGYAVALLSAAVGYNGDVTDIPGEKVKLAGRMPIHIVIVGSSSQVATVLKAVEEDTGIRSFREAQPKYWHAALFDSRAGLGVTLGAPAIASLPQRGVWSTGTGVVASSGFVGQFVVGRSDAENADRQIKVQWPVKMSNPLVPVEYRVQPDSEVWIRMPSATRCEDGWQSVNDPALRPAAVGGDLKVPGEPPQQSLFASGVPFQMAPRTPYLWRLGWKQEDVRRASSEDEFLKVWSVDASGLADVRTRYARGGLGGIFPTYDLEALYLDLWQSAYGTRATATHPNRFSTFLAAIVQ